MSEQLTALVNGRVLVADDFVDGAAVLLGGGRIVAVVDTGDARVASAAHVHDLAGASLVPGFIDTQVNGGGGILFNDAPTPETLRRIANAHRRFGTTGMLPTLISDDVEVMRRAIAAVDEAIAAGVPGILGIHLEGPYLATARKGVHDATKFRVPDDEEVRLACSLRNGRTLLTLAPERIPATLLARFVEGGAVVAAGHTAASYAEMRAALACGLRGFTHLYNAMSPLTSREPGAVGAALEDPHSWCGVIVDGHHVHPAALRLALAAKPRGKVFLVTDAMPPVGADDPTFVLNGETITCRDGRCANAQGVLAGSALDMATAVRNAVTQLHTGVAESVRMASAYPAAFLGLADTHGKIDKDYAADLVVLGESLQVRETWISGKRVFVN